MTRQLPRIAIIGAGIAGLVLARQLSLRAEVQVFEKSRGLGGRMSNRRMPPHDFDHGAQYFTAHGASFRDFLAPLERAGHVAQWSPRLVKLSGKGARPFQWRSPRYVAVPAMTGVCKAMGEGIVINRGTRITAVARVKDAWSLHLENGETRAGFDWVLSTAPHVQTKALLPDLLHDDLHIRMQGCFSLMLGLSDPAELPWDAAVVEGNPVAWIAANHSKPGRPDAASYVCQANNDWADAHLDADLDQVQTALVDEVEALTDISVRRAEVVSLHRWRYAKVHKPAGQDYLLDPARGCGAAGDWCCGGRVEAAYDSAMALAAAVRERIA